MGDMHELRDLVYDFVGELAQAEPDPARWAAWLLLLAESLEAEAERRGLDPAGAELALAELRRGLAGRLDHGRW